MRNNLPVVALVGPPNAGKSSLMNKISGNTFAVTSDVPGTTRDRQYSTISWADTQFQLLDTAGLDLAPNTAQGLRQDEQKELEANVQKQLEAAMAEADIIVLVVDGKQPAKALPQQTVLKFRKLKKPKILAVNKLDSTKKRPEQTQEFAKLGVKPMFGMSALTGAGIGDLLDCIIELIKKNPSLSDVAHSSQLEPQNNSIAVAIVGKPNTGKSSLFNAILKQERAVVSAVAGTTRTAIDSEITINNINYTFIDTAGLKRKEYRQSQPDVFSVYQTFKSIRRSDVVILMLDAGEEITSQDQRIAREIFDMSKGCVIAVNKTDIAPGLSSVQKKQSQVAFEKLKDRISVYVPFLWMCPLFFTSAKIGENIDTVIGAIKPIFENRKKQISQEYLNAFLAKRLQINPPKRMRDQKIPKVYSLTQTDINPPTFVLTVNHPAVLSMQFRKYLENSIIKELGFWGTPIKLHLEKKVGRS